jgi:hypothetical protein
MKRDRLDLGNGMSVETYRDWNGRHFIACAHGTSAGFDDVRLMRRFLQLSAKTPSRERLDAWLVGLEPAASTEPAETVMP